jgi:O-antigen/teichoic acid export membrane protein
MADSSGRSTAKPEDRERGTPDALDASLDPAPTFTPIDTSRGRFKRNVLANLIYFVFNAGIQLWFVRYLIDNLGVATYGLVPLATNITNYMAIITVALSGSVGRFLTIDLARGDLATANRTFNTSLFASIVLAVALVPVAGALSWFAPSFLNVPTGEETGTRFLLMCTCFAFLLNAIGSNFACSTFAKNRFDVQRGIDALGFITQIGVVVALFTWAEGDLWYVGAGVAASAVVRQLGYQVSWRRLTPELSICRGSFDRTRLREILGMGGWLMVNRVGSDLFLHVDLLIVNMVVGAHAAGLYAPGLQIAFVLRAIAGMISGVLVPTYSASFAVDDIDRMVRISKRIVKLLGLAMAIPIGIVCGLSEPLLVLWLGEEFRQVAPLLILMVIHLGVNIAVTPLFGINQAANRIKWIGIVTLLLGAANVGLAVWLAGPVGWGVYGVAAAGAIVLTAKNAFYTPAYAAWVLNQPLTTFASAIGPSVLATLIVAAGVWGLAEWLGVTSLLGTVVLAATAAAASGLLIIALFLGPEDRRTLGLRCLREAA